MTPIFSASLSGLVKSFLNVLEPGCLEGTPMVIGATGGTAKHSLALKYAVNPVLQYGRARVAPTTVFAASNDWGETALHAAPAPELTAGRRARGARGGGERGPTPGPVRGHHAVRAPPVRRR
ncbi:MAG: NAD(P)H-dependent oxidoreductase [Actinomycetota bacterium]|nr:NAD(P)H-dependent oxidoreductase [Actinomycetota bacterium]